MSILFEPAIAHFGKAKHSLDDPDRMLDFGPHLRFGAIFRALDFVHNTAIATAPVDEVFRSRCELTDYCPLAAIRLVAPHAGFVPVQQVGQYHAVGDISRRGLDCVDQLAAAVDPEMRLHPEIPLVALLGLMHLGIARLIGILGRGRRIDDRRIDNRAGRNFQPLRSQVPLHLVEQPPTQIVLFEQVTEAAHRSLIRHWLAAKSLPSRRRGSMPTNRRIAGES